MTANDPVKAATRENLPPGDPLSVVSICLDKDTWGVLKLFADSVPLTGSTGIWVSIELTTTSQSRLDRKPCPSVCLLDFDHDGRSAALVMKEFMAL
jgi:hypothetical protein